MSAGTVHPEVFGGPLSEQLQRRVEVAAAQARMLLDLPDPGVPADLAEVRELIEALRRRLPAEELDSDLIEAETVACAKELTQLHPDMGAIVLECSMLPPYAKAVQDATGLPVFDFITMINYFHDATHRQPYRGYY